MGIQDDLAELEGSDDDIEEGFGDGHKCSECAICVYKFQMKYNLYSGDYKNLTLAYKYLLTLPITQVECEHSFSTLKFIKNRLRSTLCENNLEALMLMSSEKRAVEETTSLLDRYNCIFLLIFCLCYFMFFYKLIFKMK